VTEDKRKKETGKPQDSGRTHRDRPPSSDRTIGRREQAKESDESDDDFGQETSRLRDRNDD